MSVFMRRTEVQLFVFKHKTDYRQKSRQIPSMGIRTEHYYYRVLLIVRLLQHYHCYCGYRGNYYYDLSLRPRKTQRVNSTTPGSRRFLKSFPIFSNLRHVFRRLCPIRGPFIALRQCRRRVNSTTPRSRFLQRLPNLQQCRRWSKYSDFVFKTTMGFSPTLY